MWSIKVEKEKFDEVWSLEMKEEIYYSICTGTNTLTLTYSYLVFCTHLLRSFEYAFYLVCEELAYPQKKDQQYHVQISKRLRVYKQPNGKQWYTWQGKHGQKQI